MQALVIRFSSLGDVALTVPVLRGVLAGNERLHITFVSNKKFAPLFYNIPRLRFYGVELSQHKGIGGLHRLFKELASLEHWDKIIDLHSVMRTWVISTFFKFSGHRVYEIDKGRDEKKALIRQRNKELVRLPHTTERYLQVFSEAGIPGTMERGDCIWVQDEARDNLMRFLYDNEVHKEKIWLGIAPFSKHREKEWPLPKVNELISKLAATDAYKIMLLGGGDNEVRLLKQIAATHEHTLNLAGVLGLEEEISLMHHLDCVVSMDSFNMHLAALCGVKVVSIWGATHYFAGFGPLNDNEKYIVETSPADLSCRPCSVFGDKPCFRGDLACLTSITVEQVMMKIEQALDKA